MKRYALSLLLGIFYLVTLTGCQSFGKKLEFNKGELYYTDSVTEAEANKLGEYLVKGEFFDGKEKTVQVNKEGGTYQFRMVVGENFRNDQDFLDNAKTFCSELSINVFGNAPVEVHVCDERLNTLKVVKATG